MARTIVTTARCFLNPAALEREIKLLKWQLVPLKMLDHQVKVGSYSARQPEYTHKISLSPGTRPSLAAPCHANLSAVSTLQKCYGKYKNVVSMLMLYHLKDIGEK